MKKLIYGLIGASLLITSQVYAQVYASFDPAYVTFSKPVHAGTQSFSTTLTIDSHLSSSFSTTLILTGSPGVSVSPDTLTAYGRAQDEYVNILVQVNPDNMFTCYGSGEPAGVFVSGATDQSFWIYGYIYDPQIQGRVKLASDTLNFGSVAIGIDSSLKLGITMDTDSSAYPTLVPFGMTGPFLFTGDFLPDYSKCNRQFYDNAFFGFTPKQIGKYIDTVYIYNPIRKDSTMLILIGEGVAAGVGNSVEEASRIAISPNPCDKHCTLSMSGGQIEHVMVSNLLGECVFDQPSLNNEAFTMSTASLPNGVYFIEVRSKEGVYRERAIVVH